MPQNARNLLNRTSILLQRQLTMTSSKRWKRSSSSNWKLKSRKSLIITKRSRLKNRRAFPFLLKTLMQNNHSRKHSTNLARQARVKVAGRQRSLLVRRASRKDVQGRFKLFRTLWISNRQWQLAMEFHFMKLTIINWRIRAKGFRIAHIRVSSILWSRRRHPSKCAPRIRHLCGSLEWATSRQSKTKTSALCEATSSLWTDKHPRKPKACMPWTKRSKAVKNLNSVRERDQWTLHATSLPRCHWPKSPNSS